MRIERVEMSKLEQYAFILTDKDGRRLYGSCLRSFNDVRCLPGFYFLIPS